MCISNYSSNQKKVEYFQVLWLWKIFKKSINILLQKNITGRLIKASQALKHITWRENSLGKRNGNTSSKRKENNVVFFTGKGELFFDECILDG